jgi:predicted phosphoadenosine phosphosulfate sulfurtransferase
MARIYKLNTVVDAARERISLLFDLYKHITVSVSGGKDSSVMFDLVHKEAIRRNRTFEAVFIDQEAEYANTIAIIRHLSRQHNVIFRWYQVPFQMTNSASYEQDYLNCWDGGHIRELEKDSIKDLGLPSNLTWEKLLPALESQYKEPTAQLIGLRSSESLNRYRAVTKNPAIEGINWSTKTSNSNLINFYPIYDFGFDDIWRYMFDNQVKYNKVYDWQFAKNYHKENMRVSCLIHEKSFDCLADLPEFEPETYHWLCQRIKGVATAMRYVKEKQMYSNEKLPTHYKTWKEFRDFLLDNHHNPSQKARFIKRFENHPNNEDVYKQQVGQLLINDFENITDVRTDHEEKRQIVKQKYIDIL